MLTSNELERSDFMRWFNFHEEEREPTSNGGVRLRLKPGGHQEAIDLELMSDNDERVYAAILTLDRAWVDGDLTAMLANDITKSFLQTLAPDDPSACELADHISRLHRGGLPVLVAGNGPSPVPPPSGAIAAALRVFSGTSGSVELLDSDRAATLRLEHVDRGGAQSLRITVHTTMGSTDPPSIANGATAPGGIALQENAYLGIFLDADELPVSMRRSHDNREIGHYRPQHWIANSFPSAGRG